MIRNTSFLKAYTKRQKYEVTIKVCTLMVIHASNYIIILFKNFAKRLF